MKATFRGSPEISKPEAILLLRALVEYLETHPGRSMPLDGPIGAHWRQFGHRLAFGCCRSRAVDAGKVQHVA
jgi:hypothetical protein